jgi:hypothetical protein
MNRTSSITAVFLTATLCLQVTSYGQQKSEPSRKSPASSVSDIIDWDRVYEEALESNADIRRKVEQGKATKAEVIEWLKLVGKGAEKRGRDDSGHNFPATAYEYAKLIEPQLGVPPRVDLNKAVEIPLFVNGKRAYGNLGTACDNRTYLGKATVSGSTLQRHVGRTAEGKSMPDVIWISFGRNSTVDFEKIDGSVQMIGYNKKTGATAFFESNGSNLRPWISLDEKTWRMRGVMPWIDDPDEFNRAFVTPGRVQCVECHQADPFITNDFINAAKIPGTDESVVPALDKDSPYYVIGGENWDMRTIHIEGNACFECHRVGMTTMSLFMRNDWDPNQHMPPHNPGSLKDDFEELLAAWKNGPENTPGSEWIIPPAGSAPGRIVGGDYPHKAAFNEPDLKALGRGNQKPRMIAEPEWTQSYKAGYVDARGHYAGGSEILHLEGHKGKLYAANSYWMDPSNIWYGGKDPKTPWSQILRLDGPNGKWEVDLELGPNNLRAENLKSVTFGTDGAGNSLERPVTLLIATAYSPKATGADINVFVRDDAAGTWEKTVLIRGTGEGGENNSTRCMTVYRDRVTGVDRLFLPVGLLGIFTGVYDADVPGKIRWDETPETGRLEKRSLAIVEANDSLVYSSGTKIYRRNDGPSPTHSMIFDASQLSKGPVASPVGGVRGLSVIPSPEGQSESLLFVWAPDSKSRSCVVRLDQDETGKYLHTKEECVADLMSEYLSGNPVYYALAGYNQILPVLHPTTKEPAYLMGFECWVGGRQFSCWQGNDRGGFYAGAMYAIRDKNAQYWLNEVNGPTTVEKNPLQSVRTYEVSPFESEKGKVIYFGGFVADHGPSHNTAWVYKTLVEHALRKDAPRPVRLTPEHSKAQLAALRQPYLFEYRGKPAFTIQIPGEFARGNASGGNVFHAKKAFNTLSISVSQSEDPEQAARRYVEALKRAGNGTAKMLRQSEAKLPNGTPAVEFVATWVTKQNAKQTTQALTACKDGHAVTIATHTWEVPPPDKRFFFTLDFE